LEQIDSPEQIYHVPATPFVADFVGQADFIPGLVQDGRVRTELGDFPNTLAAAEGTQLVVMIRPDDIHLIPNRDAGARIVSRQFRGSENLYAVRLGSGQVVHGSESSTTIYREGTAVDIRVSATHTVLFPASPYSSSFDHPAAISTHPAQAG
jgi:iron(III) transport system ATP-binding protein